jgi:hypothetical protein
MIQLKRTLLVVAMLLVSSQAQAYPTSVVFTPTGESHALGGVGLLAYTSTNLSPRVSVGASWFGAEAGVLPQWQYGDSGVSFGGLELGFDLITPYQGIVKPVFNAKLGLVTEGRFSPSVAVGIMEVSPTISSMDYVFVSATKKMGPVGRLTLGFGDNAGNRDVFAGSFPFNTGARQAIMAAYESPLVLDRLGFVADYFGGVSEVSDIYLGVTLALSSEATFAVGGFLDTARSDSATRYDGLFAALTYNFDATRLFSKERNR